MQQHSNESNASRSLRSGGTRPICAAIVLVLAGITCAGFMGIDRWFYEVVSLRFNTPRPFDADSYHRTKALWNLARFWPHVTGGACCYVAIFAFARRGFRKANAALFAVLVTALTAHVLQCGISRARPNQSNSAMTFLGAFESGFKAKGVGMPSGEVATATAMSLIIGFAFPRRRAVAWIPTGLVILARLLPGMHYLSDVAAGSLLALLLTPMLYRFALRTPPRFRLAASLAPRNESPASGNQPVSWT